MRLAAVLVATAVVALLALAAPLGAIETTEFGIEPAEGDELEVEVRAGETSTVPIRLWNQAEGPLELRLELSPATVDPDGTASLEGDPAPVGWAELEQRTLRLDPGASRVLDIVFEPPSPLAQGEHTIAVVAQAQAADGGGPAAVVQRLAPIVYVHAIESVAPESNALGILPWIAGVLALAAAIGVAVRARKQRAARRLLA